MKTKIQFNMKTKIQFNKEARAYKYSVTLYDDNNEYLFGVMVDALSEQEAKQKAMELWGMYGERLMRRRKRNMKKRLYKA